MTDLNERKFHPHFAYPILRDPDGNIDGCMWKSWKLLTNEDILFAMRGLWLDEPDNCEHLAEFAEFVLGYADDLHRGLTLGEAVADSDKRRLHANDEPGRLVPGSGISLSFRPVSAESCTARSSGAGVSPLPVTATCWQ